ncbi:MAG TPA: hypothetical protein VJN96_13695 [Vicinamibacterales bacterium]|nr:hypothetical protein [Vicinamibacterales bacterium]
MKGLALGAIIGVAVLFQAPPQKFVPDPVQSSDLKVRLDLVGTMPSKTNPTSPAVAGSTLLLIDQGGALFAWNGTRADLLLSKATVPPGVKPMGYESFLNVAANKAGTTVYVMFISSSVPKDVPKRPSPRDQSDAWYLLYAFDFDGASLTRPRPIVALQERWDGHSGGGMIVLPDESVLFAAGDNGDSYEDGGLNGQNPAHHLAKIVQIDPATGAVKIVALGVRACQRLTIDAFDGEARLTFADPGGWVSEELDSIRVADLLAATPPNFGWGRAAIDKRSREGTFYIDQTGNSIAKAPLDEPGFVQPVAEFGREKAAQVAISGPVHSAVSFKTITFLFGDLVSGSVYAVTGPPTVFHQPVLAVTLVDSQGQTITIKALSNAPRGDPRFFTFPDGSAGVLVEATGQFFRLTEVGR